MFKKLKITIISNLIVRVFMIAFAVIFPASVYASSALNTPCGSGSFAGTSYLSTPCSSSYNCCIAPNEPVVKKVQPVVKKQIKKAAVSKKPVITKRVSTYNISANYNDIRFPYNSAMLTSKDIAILHRDAEYLKHNKNVVVQIQGNCDRRGSEAYNMALGWRRANIAKSYLEKLGISGNRLKTVSFGKEKPICSAHTLSCYAINRRDHFVIVSK
jgi:peptidoglycan-associated lipoprotein